MNTTHTQQKEKWHHLGLVLLGALVLPLTIVLAPWTLHAAAVPDRKVAVQEAYGELPGKSNYFIGNDPKKWRANIANYAKVRYRNVYPGVDLVYYGNQQQLEYDFVVGPGADPGRIALRFQGADRLEVDTEGDLVL